ncbi:MAG: M55 family metallopeptidase [Thermaerobacterales bacterium]
MKIYISADMEGCSGIVHTAHTDTHGFDYEPARRWFMDEVNAAVAGAFDGGAAEVVVSDSHGGNGNRNLILDDLDSRAELITGRPRALGQLDGIDESYAAVFLVGYHTMHGTAGVLSHTTNGRAVANLWVNDTLVGEIGLNAHLAGSFGVPVALITGDDLTIAEAQQLIPDVEGAVVKQALSRYAARCLHPQRAHQVIRAAARRAVEKSGSLQALPCSGPVKMRLQFKDTGGVDAAARLPEVEVIDDETVEFRSPDMAAAYMTYSALVGLWPNVWGNWARQR